MTPDLSYDQDGERVEGRRREDNKWDGKKEKIYIKYVSLVGAYFIRIYDGCEERCSRITRMIPGRYYG